MNTAMTMTRKKTMMTKTTSLRAAKGKAQMQLMSLKLVVLT